MKRRTTLSAMLILILACSASFGAECKKVKLNIAPPQERNWPSIDIKKETRPRLHAGSLGTFTGTYDHCSKYRAHIKDPFTGELMAIPFFYMCVLDLSYIETQQTLDNLPKTVLDWTLKPTEKGRNTLTVTILDKNEKAVPNYMFGLDYIRLKDQP